VNKQTPEPRPAGGSSMVKRLAARPARIPSRVVLGGDSEVVIVHGNEEYLLRATHDGKLILSR
jgi:hemin uptake protein HemP